MDTSLRILIVEDEAIISMDIEAAVEDCGHVVVGTAASLRELAGLTLKEGPDLAFVDLHLKGDGDGIDVCAHVLEHWPSAMIVFVTANPRKLPADFAGGHGVIPKPFTANGLISAIHYLEEGIMRPPPSQGLPGSFTPSPEVALAWKTEDA